jgi:hypothetical protein
VRRLHSRKGGGGLCKGPGESGERELFFVFWIMEILNDPPQERESDEVSLINLTLMESFVANLKISQRKLAERIKV